MTRTRQVIAGDGMALADSLSAAGREVLVIEAGFLGSTSLWALLAGAFGLLLRRRR